MAETPSVRDGAQHCENKRKKSFSNYESRGSEWIAADWHKASAADAADALPRQK
jgi:hypothetical protein